MERSFFAGSASLNINVKHFPVACCYTCLLDSTVKLQSNILNTKENKQQQACRADTAVIVL